MNDLSDADLRLVPVEGMHPIALQLGHLILAEQMFGDMVKPGSAPALPDGFKEAHDLKNKELTDSGFSPRTSTSNCLRLSEPRRRRSRRDSRRRSGRHARRQAPSVGPTVGAALLMAGMHSLNHSGQFVAVRRMLKKPIAF